MGTTRSPGNIGKHDIIAVDQFHAGIVAKVRVKTQHKKKYMSVLAIETKYCKFY